MYDIGPAAKTPCYKSEANKNISKPNLWKLPIIGKPKCFVRILTEVCVIYSMTKLQPMVYNDTCWFNRPAVHR